MIQIKKIEGGKWNDVEFISGRMTAYGTEDVNRTTKHFFGYGNTYVDHAPDQMSFDGIILALVEDAFSIADAKNLPWSELLPMNIQPDEAMMQEDGYVGTLEDGRTVWFRDDVGADDFSMRTISFYIFNSAENKGAK